MLEAPGKVDGDMFNECECNAFSVCTVGREVSPHAAIVQDDLGSIESGPMQSRSDYCASERRRLTGRTPSISAPGKQLAQPTSRSLSGSTTCPYKRLTIRASSTLS